MKYNPETLREKAKELLGQTFAKENHLILNDIEKLVEEYNIHKIELELQQDEIFRVNQELEEKNRRLDDLFENAPLGYFILNSQGLIVEINSTATKLFEKPKELILQKPFNLLVHPSSQDRFYFHWQKIIETKCSGNVEIAMTTGKTESEHFLLNSLPYFDKEQQQWYVRLSATNVSDIKEADVLRDSERRYRLLFKNMINGLLVLKPVAEQGEITDFRFFRANAAFEQITGYISRAMEGASLMHVFPDNGQSIFAFLMETARLKLNQKMVNFHLSNDIFVNLYSFIPEEGYVAMIVEDVTAQMNSEKERLKSEELLQTIFKILPVGVTVTDMHGSIIDCNPASEALLGIKKEQHLVRHLASQSWEIIRTDLSPKPPDEFASVIALRENRIVENVEMGIVKNQAGISWINVSAAPIPLPDMGVAIVYSDITERVNAQEETEEKFKNIIQNSTDAIIIVNQSGAIIEWNKGCELIFGFKRKIAIGQKIWSFMQNILLPDPVMSHESLFSFENITEALKTGESKWFQRINETAIKGLYGKPKILQSVAFPVKSAGGYLLGVVARDISESKETENMLKIAKEKAEEASHIKSQFLANISHEIRTPLNAIMGFTEILKEFPVTDQKFKSHLSGIEKSSKALMALISDILDLSRIEAGKMVINPSSLTIANLVGDVKQIFSLKAEQKGIDFQIIIDDNVPRVVFLDELRLRQILFNLVGNAVKFTQQGYIRVEVSSRRNPDKEKLANITFKVIDSGPGIDLKDMEAIFDPFFQKKTHETAKQEGTGLGLAISRRFAQMMHGEISVDSIKGQGTEFQLLIPDVPIMETPGSSARDAHSNENISDLNSTAYKELTELIFRELISKFGSHEKANEFLKNQIWSEYDKIADILGFDEVISFTGLLLEISEKNDLQYLKEFGNRLSREAASFNVIEINRMLTSFEVLRQYNLT
jgi:PAS domain S-box-containing protein